MKLRFLVNSVAVCVLLALSACGVGHSGKHISEGVITYKLDFPESENSSSLVTFLPKEMTMSFKDNSSVMQINGWGGSFGLTYFNDHKNKKNYAMLRIMFKTYICVSDLDVISFGYSKISDLEVSPTSDTLTICGYLCRRLKAESKNANKKFEAWVTDDIELSHSNNSTPYKDVEGVLMRFDVLMCGIYMKMEATKVEDVKVPDEIFSVPDDAIYVTRQELEELIGSFDRKK
jgi:hypothetical protein